jgi:hypothetical protein
VNAPKHPGKRVKLWSSNLYVLSNLFFFLLAKHHAPPKKRKSNPDFSVLIFSLPVNDPIFSFDLVIKRTLNSFLLLHDVDRSDPVPSSFLFLMTLSEDEPGAG